MDKERLIQLKDNITRLITKKEVTVDDITNIEESVELAVNNEYKDNKTIIMNKFIKNHKKYNRSQIMKRAGQFKREHNMTYGEAIKESWKIARLERQIANNMIDQYIHNGTILTFYDDNTYDLEYQLQRAVRDTIERKHIERLNMINNLNNTEIRGIRAIYEAFKTNKTIKHVKAVILAVNPSMSDYSFKRLINKLQLRGYITISRRYRQDNNKKLSDQNVGDYNIKNIDIESIPQLANANNLQTIKTEKR